MKIKSRNNFQNPKFDREKLFRFFRIRPFLVFFATIIIILAFSLLLIFYGAVLQKNQTMSKIQQIVFNATETKFSVFNNYVSGLLSSPDRLFIDVKFEGIQLLNYARESALSKGVITDEEQQVKVNAQLTIGPEVYKVKISPTGLNLDMIGSIKKRAYKVRVLEGKKIYGMEEFKLLPPISRHNIVEWVGHALEDKEGLISLRYFFVEATLNGDNLGVYAIEEHFNKELLENREAREGIIFSIKNNQIKIFNEKKVSKDLNQLNQIRFLKSALQGVKNNEIEISRIFDLEKYASHFAIIDLMNGYHASGANSNYYLNPITNLIEPITREYNSLRYSEGQPSLGELMIEINQEAGSDWNFANKLFQNREFTLLYLSKLLELSDKKYLDEFFEDIDQEMSAQTAILYKDDPFYKFPKEYIYERQKQIREKLNQDLNVVGNIDTDVDSDETSFKVKKVKFKNRSSFPVELIEIFSFNKNIKSLSNQVIFSGEEISFPIEFASVNAINGLIFNYKIYGIKSPVREAIIVPKSFDTGISLPKLWNSSSAYLFNSDDVVIDSKKMTILFNKKVVNIKKDLFIPKNFIVEGFPGLTINLTEGASIYSKSAFNFIGSKINPIKITSLDKRGGGLVISGPKIESVFKNTIFEDLSSPNIGSSGLTGSVTIYNTNVSFKECLFDQNKSEDFLNLVHSKYTLTDSFFISAHSDAVDSDYSQGEIINSVFTNIGNDAMDFSGSISKLSGIQVDGVGDKAISAGEMSKILGQNIYISNAEIGITSKDLSEVNLNDLKLNNVELGFAVYQKKEEYGAGKVSINSLEMSNVDTASLVEHKSTLMINGKEVMDKISRVEDFLYGVNFGKSTK